MIRYLSKAKRDIFKGKIALLRLDLNTKDDWRMEASLSTIDFLRKHCRALVILSHKGRPRGSENKFSLRKDAKKLGRLLHKEVGFFPRFEPGAIREVLSHAPRGSVFMLENLRFLPGEDKNSRTLGKQLGSLGDVYVNDAFAVSHRANASVVTITEFLPSYAGFELEAEMRALSHVMQNAKRPLVLIFGGAKISDKLDTITNFKGKADAFLMAGALANTLLALTGIDVRRSKIEKSAFPHARKILRFAHLMLPVDYKIQDGAIRDIGPKTIQIFSQYIKNAKTIIWNGPLGLFEEPQFRHGTKAIARAIARNRHSFSLVGGGETVMALRQLKMDRWMSFVSTGGGAMLEFLAGKKLPGIEALKK